MLFLRKLPLVCIQFHAVQCAEGLQETQAPRLDDPFCETIVRHFFEAAGF